MNQTLRNPDELHFHPLLESMPAMPVDSPEMLALIASVEAHGCLRSVLINDRNEIMDGRSLVYAAGRVGLEEVPCLILPDDDAPTLALDTLCARRHLSKSARAYLAFPLLEAASQASSKRRLENLKAGKKSRTSLQATIGKTVEQYAASLGFARDHFYRAREVFHLFQKEPAYREQMEGLLLSGEVSLQGVIAGWTGIQNAGQPRKQSDQLILFRDVFGTLRYHFQHTWKSLAPERRQALVPQVRDTVAEMPPEVREMFASEIRAVVKAAKEAGQTV